MALTELRDASFINQQSFACGEFFVIGQGKLLDDEGCLSQRSPLKRYTPSKPTGMSPSDTIHTNGFTPRGILASQALSEIESLGLHEDQSSLPQQYQLGQMNGDDISYYKS